MPKYIKKIIFISISLLFINTNVYAKVDISGGGMSTGSNSPCGSTQGKGYIACYSPKFQFRVTLVDKNGKKVAGTNSVDFTHENSDTVTIKNANNVQVNGKEVKLINGGIYKYRNYKDNDEGNKANDFQYVSMKLIGSDIRKYQMNGIDNHAMYNNFFTEFSNDVKKRIKNIKYNGRDTDFLSMFAYLSGFTKKELQNKEDITIEEVKEKVAEIAKNDYYLQIEPTFAIYYTTDTKLNTLQYVYGTGYEILEWMNNELKAKPGKFNDGYLRGLSLNFVYQATCNLYTKSSVSDYQINSATDCNWMKNTLDSGSIKPYSKRIEIIKDIVETNIQKNNYGYGEYILSLKDEIDNIGNSYEFEVDECENPGVGLKLSTKGIDFMGLSKDFLVSGDKNDSTAVYCYDEVSYDYSPLQEYFKPDKKLMRTTYINIPEGNNKMVNLHIDRTCYYEERADKNIKQELKFYKDNEIYLNILNKELKLTCTNCDTTEMIEKNKTNKFSIKKGEETPLRHYSAELSYGYNEKIYISEEEKYDGNIEIRFKNNDKNKYFGNMPIIEELYNKAKVENKSQSKTIGLDTYTLTYKKGDSCKLNYKVQEDSGVSSIKFRIINLDNPFPARDGTSRLPGMNWLNERNYVYNYITNNRGIQYINKQNKNTEDVSASSIYTMTEPMYTIELTPSTMANIRRYNDTHTYDDIKLTCNNTENNKECTSDFLRNNNYINKNISGACADNSKYNNKTNYGELEDEIRNTIYATTNYVSTYDLNKNGKMDTEDLEIFLNQEKNTFFYTCADKSFISGGYREGED